MTTLAIEQRTPEWYAARRDWIGSSDAPIIAGESPYKSPLELWSEKTGQKEAEAETDQMATGTLMEPVLRALYERRTGVHVELAPEVRQSPTRMWMTASLDGLAGDRIFEGKWTNAARWKDGLPFDVNLQVQHQMAVTGLLVADVAVLRGPTFDIIEVLRDEQVIADLIALEEDFHQHVVDRTPPKVDGSESTRQALTSLHPRETLPLTSADADWEDLAERLRQARTLAKDYQAQADTVENAARAMLGDAEGVEGKGWKITWTKNADSSKTAWEQVAIAYRRKMLTDISAETFATLAAELDTIESMYTEVKPGPRVLRTRGL